MKKYHHFPTLHDNLRKAPPPPKHADFNLHFEGTKLKLKHNFFLACKPGNLCISNDVIIYALEIVHKYLPHDWSGVILDFSLYKRNKNTVQNNYSIAYFLCAYALPA